MGLAAFSSNATIASELKFDVFVGFLDVGVVLFVELWGLGMWVWFVLGNFFGELWGLS